MKDACEVFMQEIEETVKKLDDIVDVEHTMQLIELSKLKKKKSKTESYMNCPNVSDWRFSDDIDTPNDPQVTPVSL